MNENDFTDHSPRRYLKRRREQVLGIIPTRGELYVRSRKRRLKEWKHEKASIDESSSQSSFAPHFSVNESSTGEIDEWAEEVCVEDYSPSGEDSSEWMISEVPERQIDRYDELPLSEMETSSYDSESTRTERLADTNWNLKESESKRILELLHVLELGQASTRCIRSALQTSIVRSRFSYDVLMRHINRRADVPKHHVPMCPRGHFAATGSQSRRNTCPNADCRQRIGSARFWTSNVSDQLKALCREEYSFLQFQKGCQEAHLAMSLEPVDIFSDYYDGALFRRMFRKRLSMWDPDGELTVFMVMSTDGFELYGTSEGKRTCWPIIFKLLNLDFSHRGQAANALVTGFIPGSHNPEFFESFLVSIVNDLVKLEKGMDVKCWDGRTRKLFAFVLFITADFPAASKLFGFMGHRAKLFCRNCHKKAVFVCGSLYAVPVGSERCRKEAVGENGIWEDQCWIELECPERRTSSETASVWRQEDTVPRATGIKKRPLIARLSLDFVFSFPYDHMHLCLLGWVRHLVFLVIGSHKRHQDLHTSYILTTSEIALVNVALSRNHRGIPQFWGRPPTSLGNLNHFRAEDFKNFGLYFASIVWHSAALDRRQQTLWLLTSKMLKIVQDASPRRTDSIQLRKIVQKLHALFTTVFHESKRHSFCFTPTTHAIVHLPEILRECGPLRNVSQFFMERFVGEMGGRAKSRKHPETNLFHKSHTHLCLKLLSGGIRQGRTPNGPVSSFFETRASHAGVETKSAGRRDQALAFFRANMEEFYAHCRLGGLRLHSKVKLLREDGEFTIETATEFRRRERDGTARQKFCVVGLFQSENESTDSSAHFESPVQAFFGYVDEIWEVAVFVDESNITETFSSCASIGNMIS